jgi:putative hydrolase of the HAD superfamily
MRAIAFDLDGTLLHYTREYEAVLSDAFVRVCGEVRDEWLETYSETFYELFLECEPDPVLGGFEAVEVDVDPGALRAALLAEETEMCRPPAGALDDLRRLAGEFHVGVVSDGIPEWQRHKLRERDLLEVFDAVVTSYEAGAHKPDPAPFREFEDRVGAESYGMVGDDGSDVEGARGVGWAAHRYGGTGFGDLPGAIDWDEPA